MSRKQGIAVAFKTVATLLMSLWAATSHATTELYYVHADHLGTPQVMTDKNQDVVWKRSQTPFGETVEETGTLEQPLRFPGQYRDRETGFSYNYYRDYDPVMGRYIQSDPIGLTGGLNTYAYVSGNPLSYIDPIGLALTGTGTSRGGAGGFPQGGLTNRAGLRQPTVGENVAKAAGKWAVQKAFKSAADALVHGAGGLIGSPLGVFFSGMVYSPGLGGCDENGVCSDMLPPQPPLPKDEPCEDQGK